MDLINLKFDKSGYLSFIDYLKDISNKKLKQFNIKSFVTKMEILGISVKVLRQIAKDISKGDMQGYFKQCEFLYFEDSIIYSFLLGYVKDEDTLFNGLNKIISLTDNWATCDLTCCSLKQFKKNKGKYFDYVKNLALSKKQFECRFGLVLLLDFYVDNEYIDQLFEIIQGLNCSEYYVKMATAWLISVAYIRFDEKTENYLINCNLDDFTYNKSIQKICESFRVAKDKKIRLKELKR